MEVNKEAHKRLLELLFAQIKSCGTELFAYRLAAMGLAHTLGVGQEGLDAMLLEIRSQPEFVKTIKEKYDIPVQRMLEKFDEFSADREFLEILKKWKPTGQPN